MFETHTHTEISLVDHSHNQFMFVISLAVSAVAPFITADLEAPDKPRQA